MAQNIIQNKTTEFAIEIINLYKYLITQREYILSKQILKSGTSIGANVREAIGGQSKKDFISKISIAYKVALETEYWLYLLDQTGYLSSDYRSLKERNLEIIKILTAIISTTKSSVA
jgi:four helix bundle protein